jgi:hypothetical protein
MVIKQREGSRGQLERYSATGTAQRPWRAEGVLARSIDSAVGPPPRRSPSARCSRRPAAPRQRRPPSSLSASPTTSVTAAPGGGAVNGQPGNGVETGAAAKPGADPALCNSATLSVTLGPSEGAAGTVYAPLRFSNRAGRSCVIQGFPGVSYVTGDRGDQVGQAAQRDGAPGRPVTLSPGTSRSRPWPWSRSATTTRRCAGRPRCAACGSTHPPTPHGGRAAHGRDRLRGQPARSATADQLGQAGRRAGMIPRGRPRLSLGRARISAGPAPTGG